MDLDSQKTVDPGKVKELSYKSGSSTYEMNVYGTVHIGLTDPSLSDM